MLEDYFKTRIPEFNINNTLFIARPGLPFVLGALALFLIFGLIGWSVPRNVFLAAALFAAWFFRDPERPAPPEGFGLSPADGKVIRIEKGASCPLTSEERIKVSVFMDVFSVHVNRVPFKARLLRQEYRKGSFVNASFDKASLENERNYLLLEDEESGRRVTVAQIAGLIARRIVTWVEPGQVLERGQRFGLIRFGSRLDLYLPPDSQILVTLGQKVSAGWSPLWRSPDNR
jgi:phosphatidylserine decarboxylase